MNIGSASAGGRLVRGAAAAVLLAMGIGRAAAQQLPAFVNWSNEGAWQRDNGIRGELSLNGWWRWRAAGTNDAAPPADGWLYRKVPGQGQYFDILDEAGESALKRKAAPVTAAERDGPCWVEREFTVPEAWRDRDVRLVLLSVEGTGEVFLDGERLGATWSYLTHEIPLPDPARAGPRRLSIRSGGILNNVVLACRRKTAAEVRDCYLMTSVRDKAATVRAAGEGRAAALRVVVADYADPGRVVKTAGPLPAAAAAGGGWSLETAFPWPDARLWSLDHPHLYTYHVEALDAAGAVLDRTFPVRFGFRELWIKGGRFMLNNRPVTLNMDIHTPLASRISNVGRFADAEGWREVIRQWKRLGVNTAVHRWSALADDTALYRVADEEGFFISTDIFGFQYGMPEANRLPEIQAYKEKMNVYRLLYRRHCPSLAFYYLPGTANTWDFEPGKLGEDYDTEALFGRHNRPERAFVTAFDPARVAFAGSGGGKDEPVHSSMNYIHIDADLQVHETWPSHWYTRQARPLALYEMAAPPYIADWFLRRDRGEQAHGRKGNLPFWLEVSAIYFGEEPYLREPRPAVSNWLAAVRDNTWNRKSEWAFPAAEALFIRNVYRSWRTYGVNMGFFTQVGTYIDAPAMVFKAPQVDPRQPGLWPDRDCRDAPNVIRPGNLSAAGRVAQAALRELVVYLGGPDGAFVTKDHTWFAGEEVRKAVVMMNNFDDPVTVSGAWTLRDAASNVVARGAWPATTLAAGEIAPARVHIVFPAPAVAARTVFTLAITAEADKPGALEDTFAVTVFPRPAPPRTGAAAVHLYDPVGDTRALLTRAGVAFSEVGGTLPDPGTLLVVGRNALKDAAHRKAFAGLLYRKMGYDFGVNVRNGMRVLVFEQALDNVWGLQTEQARWRRAFAVAPGHPALEGLGDGDFLYLKGESNLVDPYPPAAPGKVARVASDRFPEWGNDNSVATYSLIRPQLGACRALVACGFDLQEAALLEYAAGKGRMLFCQVDVSNRYGTDPVSTILVNNLLAYMTSAPEPDGAVGKPVDIVRQGFDEFDLDFVKEPSVFLADRPQGPISWGVTAADLYFEGFLDLTVLKDEAGETFLYGPLPGEKRFWHTLNRRSFGTNWQKMKAMQIQAALLINQGGSDDICPTPGLQGDGEELYPMDWLQGFVHPYLFMNW